jgi:hypothetical protein
MQRSSLNRASPRAAALKTLGSVLVFTVVLAALLRCTPPSTARVGALP